MKTKKIMFVFISMIVVMLCFSYSTMAWIAMNKKVWSKNQSMTIQAVSDVTTLSAYALRYDGTIGAVCYKIGEGEDEVINVEMTEFDRIFRDRTVNTPLIYAIELSNVPDTSGYYIKIKVPCNEKFLRVGGTRINDLTDDGNTTFVIQRFISNIISVKVGCGGPISPLTPTTTQRIQNNIDVFQEQNTAFQSITSGDAIGEYATVTNNVYSKEMSVQLRLSQSDYHSSIYTATNEQGVTENRLMLYIQFDYDTDLMDAYIQHMMDDSEGDISFADDLGVIQILVGTGGN